MRDLKSKVIQKDIYKNVNTDGANEQIIKFKGENFLNFVNNF